MSYCLSRKPSRFCHANRHAYVTQTVTLKHRDVTPLVTPLVTGVSQRCHMTSTPPIYLQVYLQPLGELYSRSFGYKFHPSLLAVTREAWQRMDGKIDNENATTGGR